MVNEGFTIEDAGAIRDLLSGLGVNFTLSGHIHAQDAARRETATGVIYDIATSALSVYPHQIGVLRAEPDAARWHYTVQPVDVEAWAHATAQSDPRLQTFARYSEEYFRRGAEAMVTRRANRGGAAVTDEELKILTETMGTLNMRYFAGTEYLNEGDVKQSAGYRLLTSSAFGFLSGYALTIIEDTPPSNTELYLPW
jgi:hypothetical protein